MQLSTRGRYGLRAMYELAKEYGQGPIPLKSIAESQAISESYLEQLFLTLRKDGLIKSVRGAYGGYLLNREPGDISVGDVLRSLEGSMAPTKCVEKDENNDCELSGSCVTKHIWEKIKTSIDDVIDSTSLEDMLISVENK